jgi:N-acetyltransferase
MLANVSPVTLTGEVVELVPLSREHHDGLCDAVRPGELWTLKVTRVPAPEKMRAAIEEALEAQTRGEALPFTIIHRATGKVAGWTRFGNIRRHDNGVEIGWTWVGQLWQRTAVNTETKCLLLEHAFERLGCYRVEFKTDLLNLNSQRAIERLGAVKEGVFRKHMLMPDGRIRDSVYYSIIDDDWPRTKARLQERLRGGAAGEAH